MNRQGTLHIVRVSIADKYHIAFADYASPGGAMKMKEILGEQALRDFFTAIGLQPNTVESALRGLRTEGSANVLNLVLPEEMLISMGLVEHPQSIPVRFTVFQELNGPVLAYTIAGPFVPATFSSNAGVRFRDTSSLIRALDSAGLPGKSIATSSTPAIYTVSTAQLVQLGFKIPATVQREVAVVERPGAKVKRSELEGLDLVELAVLCQKIADNSSIDMQTAQRAWELKREWVVLVASETPPPRHYRENEQIQAKKADLKLRMIDFLARVLA